MNEITTTSAGEQHKGEACPVTTCFFPTLKLKHFSSSRSEVLDMVIFIKLNQLLKIGEKMRRGKKDFPLKGTST